MSNQKKMRPDKQTVRNSFGGVVQNSKPSLQTSPPTMPTAETPKAVDEAAADPIQVRLRNIAVKVW